MDCWVAQILAPNFPTYGHIAYYRAYIGFYEKNIKRMWQSGQEIKMHPYSPNHVIRAIQLIIHTVMAHGSVNCQILTYYPLGENTKHTIRI